MLVARFHPVRGGAELQAGRLARALIDGGDEAFVLTARLGGLPRTDLVDGVPVRRLPAPGPGPVGSALFALAAFATLLARRRDWDVVHAHLASSHALAALAAARLLGRPAVVKLGGARATGDVGTALAKPGGRARLAAISRWAAAVVAPSREVLEEAAAAGIARERLRLIPNGVDTAAFAPADPAARGALRARLGLPAGVPVAVFSGRLEPGKGLECLLEHWPDADPDAVLLVAGEGSLRARLERRHGSARVRFLGWLPDVRAALGAADLFVLPSAGEGLSNALLEAMASGLVPVVSPIPANLELVGDGRTGFVVDLGDPAGPAALRAVFAARGRWPELGVAARRTVEEGCSLARVRDRWRELYAALLAGA
jgi:glycosyltransferase involved in cell wall biosynthesis